MFLIDYEYNLKPCSESVFAFCQASLTNPTISKAAPHYVQIRIATFQAQTCAPRAENQSK